MPWERTFLTQYLCAPSIGAHESLWALPAVQLSLWRVLARPTAPLRARAWIAGISLGTRSAAGPALQAEVATGTNLQGQHGSSTVTETLNFFTQIMQTSSSRDPQLRCQKGSWIIFSLCALLSSPQELFPSARRQSSLLGTWRDTLLPPSPGVQGFPEKLQRRLQKSEEKPEIRWIKTHGSRGKKNFTCLLPSAHLASREVSLSSQFIGSSQRASPRSCLASRAAGSKIIELYN